MSSIVRGENGYVYVLTNAAMTQVDEWGQTSYVLKIGATTLTPFERARQLSAATASAVPFHVAHSRWTEDCTAAETRVHDLLDAYRMNDGREFFACPLGTAILTVDDVCGYGGAQGMSLPWAELFATFPDDGSPRELTEIERAKCLELTHELEQQPDTQRIYRLSPYGVQTQVDRVERISA